MGWWIVVAGIELSVWGTVKGLWKHTAFLSWDEHTWRACWEWWFVSGDKTVLFHVFACRNPSGGLTQRRNLRREPTNVWCCCRAKTLTSSKPGISSVTCHAKVTATSGIMSQPCFPQFLKTSFSFLLKITATLLREAEIKKTVQPKYWVVLSGDFQLNLLSPES